jgi:hypothetical protein
VSGDKKETVARDVALVLTKTLATVRTVAGLCGPDRIVTEPNAFGIVVTVDGVELWIDVKAQ